MNLQPHSHAVSIYWLVWFLATLTSFAAVEFWALAARRPQDTLSAQVWRLEQFLPGQNLWQWTALHVLIGGGIGLVLIWLLFHFVLGLWR